MENRFVAEHKDFYFSVCNGCKNKNSGKSCKAFPGGIPEKILTGEHDHTKPYPGDNGIRFEKIK